MKLWTVWHQLNASRSEWKWYNFALEHTIKLLVMTHCDSLVWFFQGGISKQMQTVPLSKSNRARMPEWLPAMRAASDTLHNVSSLYIIFSSSTITNITKGLLCVHSLHMFAPIPSPFIHWPFLQSVDFLVISGHCDCKPPTSPEPRPQTQMWQALRHQASGNIPRSRAAQLYMWLCPTPQLAAQNSQE